MKNRSLYLTFILLIGLCQASLAQNVTFNNVTGNYFYSTDGTTTGAFFTWSGNHNLYIGAGKDNLGNRKEIILYNYGCEGGCNVAQINLLGDKVNVAGRLILDMGADPYLYTGSGSSELNRYLTLLNSPTLESASGLKAGGVLVSDSYSYANPGKNDLIVKGKVGIGTASPDSKLTVKGVIHAEEVKVDLAVPGPDYVFDENYPLRSLEDTKAYINQHKHLPGIPSSNEMQQNGVNLLEMNMKLLEKVEELTLHLIEQNKKLSALAAENQAHQKEIDQLKSTIK